MKYYKNTELANLCHVSEKAVRNWIDAAESGKLDLELFTVRDRSYIANTTHNLHIIEEQVEKGRKFKNGRGHKVITPKPEFYTIFSPKEITDIMINIDLHGEIPIQYSYFNGGAEEWANYVDRLLKEDAPNTIRSTIQLLSQCQDFLDNVVGTGRLVNVIDVGVGDASPVKVLLSHLLEKQMLHNYITVDLSDAMLKIAQRNIQQWFDGEIKIESYKRDITHEHLKDLIIERSYMANGESPVNIILFLGGTLPNLRLPGHTLRMLNNSMGKDDIFIYSLKTDTEASRRYFDFRTNGSDHHQLGNQLRFLPDLLGIDEQLYEVEQYFDPNHKARFTRIKLKFDVSLRFEFQDSTKTLELHKNKTILVWRVVHKSVLEVIDQFEKSGFDLLHASTAENKNFLLTISKIKTGQLN